MQRRVSATDRDVSGMLLLMCVLRTPTMSALSIKMEEVAGKVDVNGGLAAMMVNENS